MCKAVSVTVQDPGGPVTAPAVAYIRGKTTTKFDLRLLDMNGNPVPGNVDVVAVGY